MPDTNDWVTEDGVLLWGQDPVPTASTGAQIDYGLATDFGLQTLTVTNDGISEA